MALMQHQLLLGFDSDRPRADTGQQQQPSVTLPLSEQLSPEETPGGISDRFMAAQTPQAPPRRSCWEKSSHKGVRRSRQRAARNTAQENRNPFVLSSNGLKARSCSLGTKGEEGGECLPLSAPAICPRGARATLGTPPPALPRLRIPKQTAMKYPPSP